MAEDARGRFITLEGGEGAGKSTQCRRLAAALEAAGKTVVLTREPGGSEGAEAIRRLLVEGETARWDGIAELLMLYAARRDHVEKTIEPALRRGDWVVCDRFADSTMAYQGYGFELGREPVETVHAVALGALAPDLTLILDIAVEDGLARAGRRDAAQDASNRYERMDRGFHERLRQGFLDIARREPERCILIDADRDESSVAAAIRTALVERLGVALREAGA